MTMKSAPQRKSFFRLEMFGVDRLGAAFFALDEDRKYLPNIVHQFHDAGFMESIV